MFHPKASGQKLLFAGDSVTDCGRGQDPAGLGQGYVKEVAIALDSLNVSVINAGVSGDRIDDLQSRWCRDVVERRPDVVTVLIGINDTWRSFDQGDKMPPQLFEEKYRFLLDTHCPALSRLILMDPFVVPVTEEQKSWRADLAEKHKIIRLLAQEFNAVHIQTHDELNRLSTRLSRGALASDGVHPTRIGHRILAELWLDAYLGARQMQHPEALLESP